MNYKLKENTLTNVSAFFIRSLAVTGICAWAKLSLPVRGDPLAGCSCSAITNKRTACNALVLCIVKLDSAISIAGPRLVQSRAAPPDALPTLNGPENLDFSVHHGLFWCGISLAMRHCMLQLSSTFQRILPRVGKDIYYSLLPPSAPPPKKLSRPYSMYVLACIMY